MNTALLKGNTGHVSLVWVNFQVRPELVKTLPEPFPKEKHKLHFSSRLVLEVENTHFKLRDFRNMSTSNWTM